MTILNLDQAPDTPLERLMWLSGVQEQARLELDQAWAETYAQARLEGLIEPALRLGYHARKTVYRFTRNWNEAQGRVIRRWPDA